MSAVMASPLSKDPHTRPLRRGDLVRVSELGIRSAKRLKDRAGQLGRIIKFHSGQEDVTSPNAPTQNEENTYYDVEWVMGGRTIHCRRTELLWTCAELEGMTSNVTHARAKRKPMDFMSETLQKDEKKKAQPVVVKATKAAVLKKEAPPASKKRKITQQPSKKSTSKHAPPNSNGKTATKPGAAKKRKLGEAEKASKAGTTSSKTEASNSLTTALPDTPSRNSASISSAVQMGADLYEKHRREFERVFVRLQTKVDIFRHFGREQAIPDSYNEVYTAPPPLLPEKAHVPDTTISENSTTATTSPTAIAFDPNRQAPYNWEIIQHRMDHGRYVMDRVQKEETERHALLAPYYSYMYQVHKKRVKPNKKKDTQQHPNRRLVCPKGVHWALFQNDVLAMCDAALERQAQQKAQSRAPSVGDTAISEGGGNISDADEEGDDDQGQRGSLSYSVRKIREALHSVVERTGHRHELEMAFLDDRYKFGLALESIKNTEAAMQSWRKIPFPERKYERLKSDVICSGLSAVDEKIAAFELKTKLPDSFIGQSYRYDDTGQSEAWMKSVVDETGFNQVRSTKSNKKAPAEERMAALALAADEGVVRAQVSATMQSLLIAIQDRVMTECGVLRQPELRSANWIDEQVALPSNTVERSTPSNDTELLPEIVEQPVWGIDCYTRGNILHCLNIEFDPQTSLVFVEKWLLPAINACPETLAHNISNAARILEGLPLDDSNLDGSLEADVSISIASTTKAWSETLLGKALLQKIAVSAPPWLAAAANQLRRAHASLGPDFFRVHPKGHGSVVLCPTLKPNTLVTFYRGELYPSWRWGEKMDAIDITQSRKDLKPALPDFYNMALERPQTDPRGYGLLFVDASRKAGHGSSLSHSCAPTCEVRVAARDGELCIAMTTLRELEMGEELTFDYNAVTESLNEYRSAVCLCGYGKCRGSFLHFATADCYQQVLNRNSPIASRFASLIKGSMKQVMSPDDDQILRNHGFLTAAFGAISVNRHDTSSDEELVASLDMVPIWLRTYIADTLRYIEYERRALPIALICEHLAASKKEDSKLSATLKEPKPLATFFYFSSTQSDFIRELMQREGFPDSLSGIQLRHAMQKVASTYWGSLSVEEKNSWKMKAQLDYERKMKQWRSASKQVSANDKKHIRNKTKIEIDEIFHRSTISFQDADAEGVVAMEQRIQQLTQTLSRVGRVLDRHREVMVESVSGGLDTESMRKRVHAPLRVLSEKEVVDFIWNNSDGVVLSLLREVSASRFVRPSLLESLRDVRLEFASLEMKNSNEPSNERQQLKIALLKLRSVICRDLKEMAKDFRQLRSQLTIAPNEGSDPNIQDSAVFSDAESEENIPPASELRESNDFETMEPSSKSAGDHSCAVTNTNLPKSVEVEMSKSDVVNEVSHSWLDFYSERFVLHVAADLLLMYAHTSNFFVIQPYRPLQSTPIDVYARELGNEVPKSVIDVGVSVSSDVSKDASPPSGPDSCDASVNESDVKRPSSETCAPDDIVSKVTVTYDGDYISSQLLQWYNAGIGQKPGLPDLLGCTLLPKISDCWSSELFRKSKIKPDRRTTYEAKIRPKLVEWLQDPYQRGSSWPWDIRKAFVGEGRYEINIDSSSSSVVAFGTPVIDFLVMGDESNIISVINALDVDDRVTARNSTAGLLTSVDKGRPAQAVSTWVQCEHPTCMKWRKIPWFVDPDVLPERFYCEDNKWNPQASSCDAPEDDWDGGDAMVGSDGKVEGSPVNKRKFEGSLPVNDESSFRVGARFDVKRSDKDVFSVASVVKVDFSGSVKRIMFHFAKTSSDRDEWVEFESPRIAPLYSKVPKRRKGDSKPSPGITGTTKGTSSVAKECGVQDDSSTKKSNAPNTVLALKDPLKQKPAADPSDERSFIVGARFDVFRTDKKRYFFARVLSVDFSGPVKRICFRFTKTKDNHVEWFEFGSPYICPFRSKVLRVERKKKTLENNSANGAVSIQPTRNIELAAEVPLVSSSRQANEPTVDVPPELDSRSTRDVYDFANTLASLSNSEKSEIKVVQSGDALPPRSSTDLSSKLNKVVVNQEDSSPPSSIIVEKVNQGSTSQNVYSMGYVDLPLQRIYQRPPDFITHPVSSFTVNSNQVHPQPNEDQVRTYSYAAISDPTPSLSADWSGLDMLAAVTFDAATSMISTSSHVNGITPSSTVSSMTAGTPCDWSVSNNYLHHGYAPSLWHAQSYVPATQQYIPAQSTLSDRHPGRSYLESMYGGMNNTQEFSRQPPSHNDNSNNNNSRYG